MHIVVVAALLGVLLIPLNAEAACGPADTDVVTVDRSRYYQAALNAKDVAKAAGLSAIARPFKEGGSHEKFYDEIKRLHPKIVVAHYSMFAPGNGTRGKYIDALFAELEELSPRPLKYIIYSSALAPIGQLTLAGIRSLGYLKGIEDARIGLVPVGAPYQTRFSMGHADEKLAAEFIGFREVICK